MSLDIYLKGDLKEETCICDACGNDHTNLVYPTLFRENITHNLAPMARECDLYNVLWHPEENGIFFAKQIVEKLEDGLSLLIKFPKQFEKLNPTNGYGSYVGFRKAITELLEACKEFPESKFEVWR